MGMGQTVYVEVGASSVNTFSVDIPSGADTTSGYYLSYEVSAEEGGGFTGTGWYLDVDYNPFYGMGITKPQEVVDLYNSSGNNLNSVFSTWVERAGEVNVSDFCNALMHGQAYTNGCITMAN